MSDNEDKSVPVCSFCGNDQNQVNHLIGGPNDVNICDTCVLLCTNVIEGENTQEKQAGISLQENIIPREMWDRLGEYVIGQDRAKKALSVAVYNHYKRLIVDSESVEEIEIQKTNVLLVGPTGSGKTVLAQTLARVLKVPFCIVDATSLTEAGYVGEDVENILLRLIQAADYDIPRAERGIIYIDEIDKIGRKSANPSITRDVSGEGVQQALLKLIEGCVANVPPQGGRKHPQQDFLQINTDNILFICGGAFEGLEDIVQRRYDKENVSLGFSSKPKLSVSDKGALLENLIPEDLLGYGFIPEFVGRLPLIVSLDALDKEALIQILTEPKNAITKQYQQLFRLDGIELVFSDESLEAIAEDAISMKTGARGLRTIIESSLLDIMFSSPSIPEASKCILDKDSIRGVKRPALFGGDGNELEWQDFMDVPA